MLSTATPFAARAVAGLPAGLETGATDAREALQRAPQSLYLDLVIGGHVVRSLVRVRNADGRLSIDPRELDAAGLALPAGLPLDRDGWVALDAIPGLQADYDPAQQRLLLLPAAGMRRAVALGYRTPAAVAVDRDAGLVLDWDAYARRYRGEDTASLGTELRWFGRLGTLSASGVSRGGDDRDAYARLDTAWSYSDPDGMWTVRGGDLISGGLAWTRPVRMGGAQWRRNFGVRPDLVVYPVPQFTAEAAVPSSVELFVDNLRQYSGEVDPGPFVLNDFPSVVGAGEARVVVTDALGRRTETTVPLYVDYQRLARGLSDFSFEAGVLRRGYGADSDRYDNDAAASASWRHGLRDDFTLELHGEAGEGLRQSGVGVAWSPAARYGVLSGSYARSRGDGDGSQRGLGYQWFGPRFGVDAYRQRASAGYRDLGALDGGKPPLREQDRASLWLSVPNGSLSLTWLRYRDDVAPASRSVAIGLNQAYRRFSYSLSAFDDNRGGRGASLSISVPLAPALDAGLALDRRDGHTEAVASLRRSPSYAGGWGWDAEARDDGDGQLGARVRGAVGDAWFGVDRRDGHGGAFAQGNGSLLWLGGRGFATRSIGDAFAVVSTGVPGVPILFENRLTGRTDARGYLLLPELRGWQRNRIAIDPDQLPANVEVPAIERMVTPADRSGVHVAFALAPSRSATLTLLGPDGRPVEAGTRVRRADGREAIVGFDGALWLEDYVEDEPLGWSRAGVACTLRAPALAAAQARPHTPNCRSEVAQWSDAP